MSQPNKQEQPLFSDLSDKELKLMYNECIPQLKTAKENYEFEHANMLQEKMKGILGELNRRKAEAV